MNDWKTIWNKNTRVNHIVLEMLIKADGFDSPTGHFSVEDWIAYTNLLYKSIGVEKGDSIFEVGCGSGAFLYSLYLKNHSVSGVDYSKILISLAQSILSEGSFANKDAIEIDIEKRYDINVSHGVFFYFKDLEYAKQVLLKMIQKSNKAVAILDINDKAKEERYHELRMQTMSKEEYEEKYKGLDHLFFSKEFFREIAKEENMEIEIWDQDFEKYNNSQFRFNVVMRKK